MNDDELLITEKDYLRINQIIKKYPSDIIENLEIELSRAKIISDDEVPPDLITMNSIVTFRDLTNNSDSTITLVYPDHLEPGENNISVIESLGSALIGLRKEQEINWMFPDGITRRLKVLQINYQPEANEHWHL